MNLLFHTIDHAGGVILAFMHFLNKEGSSLLASTRSDISAFVEENKTGVRDIQKQAECYSEKSGVHVSCHQLRHTMATYLLNAKADIVTIHYCWGIAKSKQQWAMPTFQTRRPASTTTRQ